MRIRRRHVLAATGTAAVGLAATLVLVPGAHAAITSAPLVNPASGSQPRRRLASLHAAYNTATGTATVFDALAWKPAGVWCFCRRPRVCS